MGHDFRGDPSSAMLEVLDTEQNTAFTDHYLEVPFDLSDVLFITTANDADAIPAPLYDRMDVIPLSSYTADEKFHIAKGHLLKKQVRQNGLTLRQLRISDDALRLMIEGYTREAGVAQPGALYREDLPQGGQNPGFGPGEKRGGYAGKPEGLSGSPSLQGGCPPASG